MNILHRSHFNTAPLLLASWTGAGNVGIMAMDYLRRKLNTHIFAQIDMSNFITPESIVVNSGVAFFPETPQSVFYHSHNPDLIIFESNAHAGGNYDVDVIKSIIELATELKAPRIYTAAALPQSMSHNATPQLLYACNKEHLKNGLESQGILPMPDGMISGLNGLILGFAGLKNIDAVCLLATIPAYASGLSYPRAALEIVKKFMDITDTTIDLDEIKQDIETSDAMFAEVEEKLKAFFSNGSEVFDEEESYSETPEVPEPNEKKKDDIPKYVMDRIEKMFIDARKDHEKAQILKTELDKWGLYKLYENRFLDLFEE
jgi:proteasome assembly chaperone (PAC2) family protein